MYLTKYNTETGNKVQEVKFKTDDVLKDIRKNGKEFDWQGKKIKNVYYSELLKMLHFTKAERVNGCADELFFKVTDDGYLKLHQVWFCKSKLCPLCNWRRSLKMSYQNAEIISEAMNRYPSGRFLFLTLTVKNVYDGDELNDTLKQMTKAFNRLVKYKAISKNLVGFMRTTEVTVNDKDNTFHPHFHILLMVKPTYFKGDGNYLTQDDWTNYWQKAMQIDYTPIVHVQAVTSKTKDPDDVKGAVLETSKYPVKDSEYLTNDIERDKFVTDNLETGLHRKRQIGYGLLFKEIRKKLQLDDVEDGDLENIGADEEDKTSEDAKIIFAKWNDMRKNYFIKR